MGKIIIIGRMSDHKEIPMQAEVHLCESTDNENKIELNLPYEKAANTLMFASEYNEYVTKHGYHFTDALSEHACMMMRNADNSAHRWTTAQVVQAMDYNGWKLPQHVSEGDVAYLANMYFADFFPDPLHDEAACLRAAFKAANDPDGYDGMVFCRWTADLIGKSVKINWKEFV